MPLDNDVKSLPQKLSQLIFGGLVRFKQDQLKKKKKRKKKKENDVKLRS